MYIRWLICLGKIFLTIRNEIKEELSGSEVVAKFASTTRLGAIKGKAKCMIWNTITWMA